MLLRPIGAMLLLALLVACEAVPVEDGDRREQAVARVCMNAVAASLKIDRATLTSASVRSLPEGDQATVQTPDGAVRCYTDLSGQVTSIVRVASPPPAA